MKPYPSLNTKDHKDVVDAVQFISRQRDMDIRDWNNLQNIYISGRKVGKIPASSIDVVPADKVGDFNVDATYAYFLINNSGTAEWRRVAVGSW